ncbi:MAG: ribulose-phosphate 3-epimerase [Armatimonadetes bacterium]|nr:ribulose-phosphate 3-epimerase [Armatimonadota bacterium]
MSVFEMLKRLCPTISVGVLTANLMSLGDDLAALDGTGVEILHFDIMDGCFCPSMTFGPGFVKGVKTALLKDVHLMIENPLPKLSDYVSAGADILTVHVESCPTHIHRVFQELGKMTNANDPERGIVRGVAINPGTPVEVIEPLLDDVDMVTLLAINPGWGGQKLIPSTSERLAKARRLIAGRDILICIDGGVTRDNITEVAKMGADMVVAGSAVFDGKTPHQNALFMLDVLRRD